MRSLPALAPILFASLALDAGPNALDEVSGIVYSGVELDTVVDAAAFLLGDPARPDGVALILADQIGVCEAARSGQMLPDARLLILVDRPDAGPIDCGPMLVDADGVSSARRFVELEWIDETCRNPRGGESGSGTVTLNTVGPERVSGYFSVETRPLGQFGTPTYDLSGSFDAPVCPLAAAQQQELFANGSFSGCD